MLSWALTIHKAQGATLDLAEIDVGNDVFEAGQTYVALSRVKSLEGLYLKDFKFQKVITNKKVRSFYQFINDEQTKPPPNVKEKKMFTQFECPDTKIPSET